MDWEQNQKPPHEGSKLHPQHQHLASPNPIGQDCLSQIKTPVTKSTDQGRRTAHVPSERNVQTHGSLAPLSCNVRLEEPLDRPLGTFGAVVQKKMFDPKTKGDIEHRMFTLPKIPFCASVLSYLLENKEMT